MFNKKHAKAVYAIILEIQVLYSYIYPEIRSIRI
jgi:hypothetical protein